MFAVASQRVEAKETRAIEVFGALDKTLDTVDLREGCHQGIAVIVVAHQEVVRHRHPLQFRTQDAVGTRIPQLDEVAGDHDALRVRMKHSDFVEADPQTCQWINALRPFPTGLDKVEIGQPNQFLHVPAPLTWWAVAIAERSVATLRCGPVASLRSE